jgi:hypothetical protein
MYYTRRAIDFASSGLLISRMPPPLGRCHITLIRFIIYSNFTSEKSHEVTRINNFFSQKTSLDERGKYCHANWLNWLVVTGQNRSFQSSIHLFIHSFIHSATGWWSLSLSSTGGASWWLFHPLGEHFTFHPPASWWLFHPLRGTWMHYVITMNGMNMKLDGWIMSGKLRPLCHHHDYEMNSWCVVDNLLTTSWPWMDECVGWMDDGCLVDLQHNMLLPWMDE